MTRGPKRSKRTGGLGKGAPPSGLTIKQALDAFVASSPARQRREVRLGLELLEACLNSYAHDSLSPADRGVFERLYDAEGAAHPEYCEIFGPRRIVPELRQFFSWFLIRKVMARAGDLAVVTREIGRFVGWLGERRYISTKAANEGALLAREAMELVPRAEEAARLWRRHLEGRGHEPVRDAIEGHFHVAQIENARVWLGSDETEEVAGPIAVPVGVAQGLAVGWEVSGVVQRTGRKWAMAEVWNVYPAVGLR